VTQTPWQHADRVRRTPQQRAALFLKQGGTCGLCSRRLRPGDDWFLEHVLALECGGADTDDNLQVRCGWHKAAKDAADHGQAGKQRQTATKHFVPKSEKHTKTRPMPGTRASGIKKKMNGSVEWRTK